MRSITVPIPEDGARQLVELARREFRQPREQASWLILDGLRRAGLDTDLETRERAVLRTSQAHPMTPRLAAAVSELARRWPRLRRPPLSRPRPTGC